VQNLPGADPESGTLVQVTCLRVIQGGSISQQETMVVTLTLKILNHEKILFINVCCKLDLALCSQDITDSECWILKDQPRPNQNICLPRWREEFSRSKWLAINVQIITFLSDYLHNNGRKTTYPDSRESVIIFQTEKFLILTL